MSLCESITLNDTRGKIIFWDIDGTLAPYRYNGHVGALDGTDFGQSIEEIEDGIFEKRSPSKFMQIVLKECQAKEHIVLGHTRCEKENLDKDKWLDLYYPFINKRIFIDEEMSKTNEIIKYCTINNLSLDAVLFVDDTITIVREAERNGINSWHISSFLDWFYNKE